jgi:putative transposase
MGKKKWERRNGKEEMGKKKFNPEQIIVKLREAEVMLSQGKNIKDVCRDIGVSDNTYYTWKKEYGNMTVDQAKQYKELEKENARLKRIVADQALDLAMLKEVARGNF